MNVVLYSNYKGLLPFFKKVWPTIKMYEPTTDEEIDLFICQYSNYDSIKKFKTGCKIVSFPELYDDGTFSVHNGPDGFVVIDKLLEQGKDVLKMFDDGTIDFDLDNRRQKSIEILKTKEEKCTIKISDYIEKMRHVPLFLSHDTPSTFVILELINRILKYLKIDIIETDVIGWNIGTHIDCSSLENILNLDKYSLKRQAKCLHANGQSENFYIVDDTITRLRIANYIQKRNNDESTKSTICKTLS